MKHREHFYIITNVLASSEGKTISELNFQNGITMSGVNLSTTPTLYYVKRGYFICTRGKSHIYKEGDTFTLQPREEYVLTSMDHSILLEFESSQPLADSSTIPSSLKYDERIAKLWVKCQPHAILNSRHAKQK